MKYFQNIAVDYLQFFSYIAYALIKYTRVLRLTVQVDRTIRLYTVFSVYAGNTFELIYLSINFDSNHLV